MPQRLLARARPDSIREFRAAAGQRYEDGLAAAAAGRRLAAVYLWGYCAEMTLKAAYFSLIGIGENTTITFPGHIQPAIAYGQGLLIAWPNQGRGHNVRAWAELLVLEHGIQPGQAYPPGFGRQVQESGQRIGQLWNETLRYHKNVPYLHEVRQVREAAEWLLVHSEVL